MPELRRTPHANQMALVMFSDSSFCAAGKTGFLSFGSDL